MQDSPRGRERPQEKEKAARGPKYAPTGHRISAQGCPEGYPGSGAPSTHPQPQRGCVLRPTQPHWSWGILRLCTPPQARPPGAASPGLIYDAPLGHAMLLFGPARTLRTQGAPHGAPLLTPRHLVRFRYPPTRVGYHAPTAGQDESQTLTTRSTPLSFPNLPPRGLPDILPLVFLQHHWSVPYVQGRIRFCQ